MGRSYVNLTRLPSGEGGMRRERGGAEGSPPFF